MNVTKKPCPGMDGVDGRVLKSVAAIIAEPICNFVNESFACGQFPENLKKSKCIPIYKTKGSKHDRANYRSICIQSQFAKIFEAAFLDRLVKFLDKFNILSECQNGFRKKRSTNTALMQVISFIHDALNGRENVVAFFYDLSRAFDTINHELLLQKLYGIGVRGVANDWIRSYLQDRSQSVVIQNNYSSERFVSLGVPQGSLLGPVLFIIFVNDLFQICGSYGKVVSYADDTNILVSCKNICNRAW